MGGIASASLQSPPLSCQGEMAHIEVLAISHGFWVDRPGGRRRRRKLRLCNGRRCNADHADKGNKSAKPAWAAACLQVCHEQRRLRSLPGSARSVPEALRVSHGVHQLCAKLHVYKA